MKEIALNFLKKCLDKRAHLRLYTLVAGAIGENAVVKTLEQLPIAIFFLTTTQQDLIHQSITNKTGTRFLAFR